MDYRGTLPAWVNTGASIQDGHMVEEYVTEEVFVDDSGDGDVILKLNMRREHWILAPSMAQIKMKMN